MPDTYCMYLRKSRADLDAEARGEGETLARHQSMLTELAKRQNLSVIKIYREIVSGDSISARPQMQCLLSDMADGRYAGVLVVEVERLARGDTIDQGIVAQAFRESNTKIITPAKTYDPQNEFDEEYFEFSLFMSRREYKTIKRRMAAGRIEAVKEGNYICSRVPYGYKKINPEPKIHTLEIVPAEAEVIRRIYELYLSGKGAKAIAGELNRLGIRPQKSEYWENPSIKKILANPLYCGKIKWKPKNGPEMLCDGLHEPIISEEVFQAAQEKRKTNPAAQVKNNDTFHNYYHNVLYCAHCGHQMKRRYIATSGQAHMLCVYRQCRGVTVSSTMQTVDESVISALTYRLAQLRERVQQNSCDPPPISKTDVRKPILAELEKAKKQQHKLCDLLEQDIYDTNTFLARSKVLNTRIAELEEQLAELNLQETKKQMPPEQAIYEIEYVLENFSGADAEERNRLLKRVARKIYYKKTQRMCKNKQTSDLTLEVDFK